MSVSASSSATPSGKRPGISASDPEFSVEIVDHRPQVQPGAADEDGDRAAGADVGDGGPGPLLEFTDRELLGR